MAANADERDLELVMQLMMNLKVDAAPDGDDVRPAAVAAAEAASALPSCGTRAEWAAHLFDRMNAAADAGDATARAAGLLETFEATVVAASRAERDVAVSQNGILKKAVLLLYQKLSAQKAENLELQRLVARCQERVTKLEIENYTLSAHLRQAQQQESSMPGNFHPGVF